MYIFKSMQAVWYNMIHQGHTTHSLSRKPEVGDVRTNSLRVRVVTEPEALVQLHDLRVRRNLHGRPLHILLLGSLGLGDSPDVPGDHRPLPIKWKVAVDRFIPDYYARSTDTS